MRSGSSAFRPPELQLLRGGVSDGGMPDDRPPDKTPRDKTEDVLTRLLACLEEAETTLPATWTETALAKQFSELVRRRLEHRGERWQA